MKESEVERERGREREIEIQRVCDRENKIKRERYI